MPNIRVTRTLVYEGESHEVLNHLERALFKQVGDTQESVNPQGNLACHILFAFERRELLDENGQPLIQGRAERSAHEVYQVVTPTQKMCKCEHPIYRHGNGTDLCAVKSCGCVRFEAKRTNQDKKEKDDQ